MKPTVRLMVRIDDEPACIDVETWAAQLVRAILELEGICPAGPETA